MVFKQVKLVEKNWRTLEGRLVGVIRPSVLANRCLAKLGSYPSTEWDIGDPSFCRFQRDDFVVLERHSWVVILARGWEKIYI